MLHCKVNDLVSVFSIIVATVVGSTVLAPVIQKNSFEKEKGCLFAFLSWVVFIVIDTIIIYSIYNSIQVNQVLSINLLTVGIASGITIAVLWGAREWRMRRQLANYKKTSEDNK